MKILPRNDITPFNTQQILINFALAYLIQGFLRLVRIPKWISWLTNALCSIFLKTLQKAFIIFQKENAPRVENWRNRTYGKRTRHHGALSEQSIQNQSRTAGGEREDNSGRTGKWGKAEKQKDKGRAKGPSSQRREESTQTHPGVGSPAGRPGLEGRGCPQPRQSSHNHLGMCVWIACA